MGPHAPHYVPLGRGEPWPRSGHMYVYTSVLLSCIRSRATETSAISVSSFSCARTVGVLPLLALFPLHLRSAILLLHHVAPRVPEHARNRSASGRTMRRLSAYIHTRWSDRRAICMPALPQMGAGSGENCRARACNLGRRTERATSTRLVCISAGGAAVRVINAAACVWVPPLFHVDGMHVQKRLKRRNYISGKTIRKGQGRSAGREKPGRSAPNKKACMLGKIARGTKRFRLVSSKRAHFAHAVSHGDSRLVFGD